MEMKTVYFVECAYWDGKTFGIGTYTDEAEAMEDAEESWNDATQEMKDKGFFVSVEMCKEIPDDVGVEDAYEYTWNEGLEIEGLKLFEKEEA